ncbi:dihydroorotate oxidase B, electron transfer subunit [Geoglobus ahangari]|uniref:Probable dihydroorotate dehydrogenase B (NAD(+)), electron transfer subunit n=1 Tax=Geoglobus ahangari TaxID=113653 RepID=A0A0F7IFU5_9EURY|nr:dihydroorotate dehydrogenase electron transfer subunit [Geoglobus ahangari]AKG90725.1 dihydroorotate oxidase B, electron transfer subunit [Geoglobus ahangari]
MFTLRVERVVRHSERISTLYFSKPILAYPGQFIMLNVFGYEEIPLSLSSPRSVTVKAVGETTEKIVSFEGGEVVGVRGPFGNPFSPTSGRALIIAGGIGVAPLAFLHDFLKRCGAEIRVVYGVKNSDELALVERFDNVQIATEDGSAGVRGTVLDLLEDMELNEYDKIYACGPEGMVRALLGFLKERGAVERAELSLERYMRCGIGVCGSCVIENGLRVCADGPVFSGKQLV